MRPIGGNGTDRHVRGFLFAFACRAAAPFFVSFISVRSATIWPRAEARRPHDSPARPGSRFWCGVMLLVVCTRTEGERHQAMGEQPVAQARPPGLSLG